MERKFPPVGVLSFAVRGIDQTFKSYLRAKRMGRQQLGVSLNRDLQIETVYSRGCMSMCIYIYYFIYLEHLGTDLQDLLGQSFK